MLGADVVMVEVLRLFLGELHDFAGPFGETIEVSSLVPACFGSLPTGAGPAVTCQPSAYRANNILRCHLLILSGCSHSPYKRQPVLPGLHACATDALNAFGQGRLAPSPAPGRPAVLCQGVQTAAGGPTAQPAHH